MLCVWAWLLLVIWELVDVRALLLTASVVLVTAIEPGKSVHVSASLIPVNLEGPHIKSCCICMHCPNLGRGVVSVGINNYTF